MSDYGKQIQKTAGMLIYKAISERYENISSFVHDYTESTKNKISNATVTNIRNGEKSVSLQMFAEIAEYLEIDLFSELAKAESKSKAESKNNEEYNANHFESILLKHIFNDRKTFVTDAENISFDGYKGTFHTYFFPTIAGQDQLLHGILDIDKAPDSDYLKADFKLFYFENGVQKEKHYEGYVIYSFKTLVITCLLFSAELGEICMLKYRHLPLQKNVLACRMAAAITSSAGDQRVPTVHRVYITRKELSLAHQEELKGHLLLNHSYIIVSKEALAEFLSVEKERIPAQFRNYLEPLANEGKYVKIEETKLFEMNSHATNEEILALNALLKISENPRYNKISYKTDEHTYGYYQSVCTMPVKE